MSSYNPLAQLLMLSILSAAESAEPELPSENETIFESGTSLLDMLQELVSKPEDTNRYKHSGLEDYLNYRSRYTPEQEPSNPGPLESLLERHRYLTGLLNEGNDNAFSETCPHEQGGPLSVAFAIQEYNESLDEEPRPVRSGRRNNYPSFNRCPDGGSVDLSKLQGEPKSIPGFKRYGKPTDGPLSAHTQKLLTILANSNFTNERITGLSNEVATLRNETNNLTLAIAHLTELLEDKISHGPDDIVSGFASVLTTEDENADVAESMSVSQSSVENGDMVNMPDPWSPDRASYMSRDNIGDEIIEFSPALEIPAKKDIQTFRRHTPHKKTHKGLRNFLRSLAQLSYSNDNVMMTVTPEEALLLTERTHTYTYEATDSRVLITNAPDETIIVIYNKDTYAITNAFLLNEETIHQVTVPDTLTDMLYHSFTTKK